MDLIETAILAVHVLIAIALVVLVLLQRGKGADAGAAFGGGSSQTVFGSAGGAGFMVKLTAFLAVVFFATSFALAVYANQRAQVAPESGIPTVEETIPMEEEAGEPDPESAPEEDDELPPLE